MRILLGCIALGAAVATSSPSLAASGSVWADVIVTTEDYVFAGGAVKEFKTDRDEGSTGMVVAELPLIGVGLGLHTLTASARSAPETGTPSLGTMANYSFNVAKSADAGWHRFGAVAQASSQLFDELMFERRGGPLSPLESMLARAEFWWYIDGGVEYAVNPIGTGRYELIRVEEMSTSMMIRASRNQVADFTTSFRDLLQVQDVFDDSGNVIKRFDVQSPLSFDPVSLVYDVSFVDSLVVGFEFFQRTRTSVSNPDLISPGVDGSHRASFLSSATLLGVTLYDADGRLRTDYDIRSTSGLLYPVLSAAPTAPVPEPSTLALAAASGVALVWALRRRSGRSLQGRPV